MHIFPVTVNNHTSFAKQLTFVRESSVILQKKNKRSVLCTGSDMEPLKNASDDI